MICSVVVSGQHWSRPLNLFKIIFFMSLCLIGYVNVGITIYRMATGKDDNSFIK